MLTRLRKIRRRFRRALTKRLGPGQFRRALERSPRKLVIGASNKYDAGWIPTEREYLDLTRPDQWLHFMEPESVEAMLAEHVWEHLTLADGLRAARTCYEFLKPGGYLRLAVPDGLNPNPEYQGWVKVGGANKGQPGNGHKVLYTYHSITHVLEQAGFKVVIYEYFSESGLFHFRDWSPRDGTIRRSLRYDPRNRGRLGFTSIVLDAIKPAYQAAAARSGR
jgi:predicted SAM-dependent methyltransferase